MKRIISIVAILFGFSISAHAEFYIFEYASQSCQTIESPATYKRLGMKVEYIQKDNVWLVSGQGINAWITEDFSTCNTLLRSMVNYTRANYK